MDSNQLLLGKVKALAAKGDPRARELITRIQGEARRARAEQEAQNALLALVEEDEPSASEEEGLTAQDDLDLAEDVASWEPTADQLAHKAALRQAKMNALEDRAKFIRVQPYSVLKGTIGGQQQVQTGEKLQVVLWTGADDAETVPCAVIFAPVQQLFDAPLESPFSPGAFRPYGILQFGTRGFMTKAEVDIGRGVQLCVNASSMSLEVALEPLDPTLPGTPRPGSMKLSGMLSFFAPIRTTPVFRTRYFDGVLGVGAATDFVVPAYAVELLPIQMTTPFQPVTLDFLDIQGVIVYTQVIAAPAPIQTPIPIAGDVVTVRVTNSGAAAIGRLRFMFALSF